MLRIPSVSMKVLSSTVRPTPLTTVSLSTRIDPWGSSQIDLGQLHGSGHQPVVGHDFVRPARSGRPPGVDALSGDNQFQGPGSTDHQRQPHTEPVTGNDVPTPLRNAKLSLFRGDTDIRQETGLQTGRKSITIDRSNDRFEDVELVRDPQ